MKHVALTHSKLRNMFGLIGIHANKKTKKITIKLVRQWKRDEINNITDNIAELSHKILWDKLYVDQDTGEHIIQSLRQNMSHVHVITTAKKTTDNKDIHRAKKMDKIEMVQFLYKMFLEKKIISQDKKTKNFLELHRQIDSFSEQTTEAGAIDYFGPGKEPDHLIKALLIAVFSVRPQIADNLHRRAIAKSKKLTMQTKTYADDLGSGLSAGQTPTGGREISYPENLSGITQHKYRIR